MTRHIRTFFILSTLLISACSTTPAYNDKKIVRFALRDDQITSWKERDDGVEVHLNTEGQRKLTGLTRNNKGSEMEIYAGRIFLTSETISTTLRGNALYVEIDDDVKDRALAMLPQGKKS